MAPVAMFPLGSVLMPHTPLALRLFEPRYLTMLGHLLDHDDPQFGVTMIERGSEVGGGEQRSRIGTMARIVQVTSAAEAMHAVAVGGERVRVTEWLEDRPYPRADVAAVAPLVWDDALAPLLDETEAIVRRVVGRATMYGDLLGTVRWDASTEVSDDPIEAVWQLAAIAPLGDFDRQGLLHATTVGGLLRQVIDLTLEQELLIGRPSPPGE